MLIVMFTVVHKYIQDISVLTLTKNPLEISLSFFFFFYPLEFSGIFFKPNDLNCLVISVVL